MQMNIPFLNTGNRTIDKAFRIAAGDFLGNIALYKSGLLKDEVPVILAGIHYVDPWIRDAAFNVWNGASLIVPEVAENTLLAQVNEHHGVKLVGCRDNHYWDAIICIIGFWHHYLYTGDSVFLKEAFKYSRNTMTYFEETEYDARDGLFRGLACCQDAISGYPDEFVYPVGKHGELYHGARDCLQVFPEKRTAKGAGIPFKSLSTNCLYYQGYVILEQMAQELNENLEQQWGRKAEKLKQAINRHFWLDDRNHYCYLVDCPVGPEKCIHQEGLGHSFAILFNISSQEQKTLIFANQHITPAGIPYIWPTFPRYKKYGEHEYGRASGTVWPHVQAFWGEAAARNGRKDLFYHELLRMARHAERDSHFAEVLHPETGEIYGGVQEVNYTSKPRQTWAASGFIRLVLTGLLGMEFERTGIRVRPWLPEEIEFVNLRNLHYRKGVLNICLKGHGNKVKNFIVNGKNQQNPLVPADLTGEINLDVTLSE